LTRRMALSALRSGRLSIICKINGKFQHLKLHRFLIWRAGEKLHRHIRQMPHDNLIRKSLYGVASVPLIKAAWSRVFKRGASSHGVVGGSGLSGEALYLELFQRALKQPAHEKFKSIPHRVLLVNAGLAAGGAERQIVNTLIGLRDSGQCESVALLAEYIDHAPQLDFFLHELEEHGIEVAQVQHSVTLADDGLSSLPPSIAELAADLPGSILEEILNLVEEFRTRRPSVIHAWQDSTSIKAGIAAVIAGVPRIILASRNVTPINFSYHRDYMHPAYRALASLESVVFLNNSEAGAVDYTSWLCLPRERFVVVRNGVDLSYLKRADESVVRGYRQSLGIPADSKVVGSVFRFWAEKCPMLWLQSAALLAEMYPCLHFLIIGEGPMRQEMEAFIRRKNLIGRIHLPGARPDVAIPLSAMDIFVLTSEFEGTPNVVLEAQWLGLPVVVTEAGGARESFKHGVTGLLVPSANSETIAAMVSEFLENQNKTEHAAKQGRSFVERHYGIAEMVDETIKLYNLTHNKICVQPVVLCGGSGTRLWPLSRTGFPKQFLCLTGDESLFQQAAHRVTEVKAPDFDVIAPCIVTGEDHRFLAVEQLREAGLELGTALLEPVSRNTAPALTLAALVAQEDAQDPVLVVTPADQTITDLSRFTQTVQAAIREAANGSIVMLGVTPDRPEVGYGYIEATSTSEKLMKVVKRFVEKPDAITAQAYLDQGRYYWNAGIFVLKASVWLAALERFRPDILYAARIAWQERTSDAYLSCKFIRPGKTEFEKIPAESVDYAVMEKCPGSDFPVRMLSLDAGWSDLGAWNAVWQVLPKDIYGNAHLGDVLTTDSHNTLVHASSRLVSLVGVENIVVIETPDAVMVAHKNRSQDVKHIVNALNSQQREEHTLHRKVHRPWGWYDSIDEGERFKVKRIQVNAGASLSLQKHHHRAEHWVVVTGTAEITCGGKTFRLIENQSAYIPLGEVHRLSNPGINPLEIIEVQSGSYLGEDDIVRFDDQYGRIEQ
jgi:mannose-1-phosphate guanylyltransferase/mannose-6-phosphate isomerase